MISVNYDLDLSRLLIETRNKIGMDGLELVKRNLILKREKNYYKIASFVLTCNRYGCGGYQVFYTYIVKIGFLFFILRRLNKF